MKMKIKQVGGKKRGGGCFLDGFYRCTWAFVFFSSVPVPLAVRYGGLQGALKKK
jgi:hypothetical protein